MSRVFTKVDGSTISATKSETINVTTKYDYGFLVAQRDSIIKQATEFATARQKDLAEVDALLAECVKLNITTRVEV